MSEEQWTPGFGHKYFQEPIFYKSPTVKEFNHDRERTDMPNASMTKNMKFYTNEEISAIWAKPVKDFEPCEEEVEIIKEEPRAFPYLLHYTSDAPCVAHLMNRRLDECGDNKLGKTNATMLQKAACNEHLLNWILCLNKHNGWYQARYNALYKINPEGIDSSVPIEDEEEEEE
eukprot:gene8219-44_t